MILRGQDGEEFSLRIIEYEFPDKMNDEWDSNWLLIETKAKIEDKSWTAVEPCLLTWEVIWLANWLESISHKACTIDEVGFLEPNLYFKLVEHDDKEIIIKVFFELENKPKWVEATGKDEIFIELSLSPEEVYAWADDLKRQRDNFPPRAGVGTQRDFPKR